MPRRSSGLAILAPFQEAGSGSHARSRTRTGTSADLVAEKETTTGSRRGSSSSRRSCVRRQAATAENERLRELLAFVDGPRFPADFEPVTARVIAQPSNPYNQRVLVAAGSSDGRHRGAPVVTDDGPRRGRHEGLERLPRR